MKKILVVLMLLTAVFSFASDFIISTGKPYFTTNPVNESYPDNGGIMMTDGNFRFMWADMVAIQKPTETSNPEFTIDLGQIYEEISYVAVKFMLSKPSAVKAPDSFIVSSSEDDELYIVEGMGTDILEPVEDNKILTMYFVHDEPITAQFINVEIRRSNNSGWVMVNEIQVGNGPLPQDILAALPVLDTSEKTYENISLGKPYLVNPASSEAYPDGGVKITDGKFAYSWADMIGFNAPVSNPTVTIDLGEVKNIDMVTGHFMRSNASAVPIPMCMIISVSDDDEVYYEVGIAATWDPPAENEKINQIVWKNRGEKITGQYVMIEIIPRGKAWTMLAELSVFSAQ